MRLSSAFPIALGLAASLSAARADECGDVATLLRQAYPATLVPGCATVIGCKSRRLLLAGRCFIH